MPHALLLSPDDQAVTAITGVLEEMSVTCERPLDGVSAAQKLNSQTFDLVLVDCENLPAAKLIFDVCRRGKNGNNPVPIAIVDGRAGLPTAFRLGAELILTKPVAKDQARTTIRTAVGRVRKDLPANEGDSVPLAHLFAPGADVPEEHAHAAAAGASPQLTSFADSAPTAVSTSDFAPKMHSAVGEGEAPPTALSLKLPTSFSIPAPANLFEPLPPRAVPVVPKPEHQLSDDPVLAELEMKELEESAQNESRPENSAKIESQRESSAPPKTAPAQPVLESEAPVVTPYQHGRTKSSRTLVALLALVVAVGGFYGAWTYQPGFRHLAQPQIDRALALIGMAAPPSQVANQANPVPQPAPVNIPTTPVVSPADSAKTDSATTDSATIPATNSTADSPTTTTATTVLPAPGPDKPVAPPAPATSSVISKPEASKPSVKVTTTKKAAIAALATNAPLPGENSAVILTSKGAEKRLAHSVPPKYPAGAEGTVVLKEVVDENGKVQGVRLVEGNAALAAATAEAVKQWRYRPYVRDGKAQPFQTVVIIDVQKP